MTLAHESLALLKSAMRANVAPELTRKLVVQNIHIQTQYSILNDQLGVAHALVAELEREIGAGSPMVQTLKRAINDRAEQLAQGETEQQIQATQAMVEKLRRLEDQLASSGSTPTQPDEAPTTD